MVFKEANDGHEMFNLLCFTNGVGGDQRSKMSKETIETTLKTPRKKMTFLSSHIFHTLMDTAIHLAAIRTEELWKKEVLKVCRKEVLPTVHPLNAKHKIAIVEAMKNATDEMHEVVRDGTSKGGTRVYHEKDRHIKMKVELEREMINSLCFTDDGHAMEEKTESKVKTPSKQKAIDRDNLENRKKRVQRVSSFVTATVVFLWVICNGWTFTSKGQEIGTVLIWSSLVEALGLMVFIWGIGTMIIVGSALSPLTSAMLMFCAILMLVRSTQFPPSLYVPMLGIISSASYMLVEKEPSNQAY